MKKEWIFFWGIIVGLGIILTVGIPITIIIGDLNNFVEINENKTFIYAPDSIQLGENISISAEMGDIDIQYTYPPEEYVAQIEIVLEMSGYNLMGDNLEDFFITDWNDQMYANLTLKLHQDIDPEIIYPFIDKLTIKVTLRADVIFNIYSHLEYGNLHVTVPFGVKIDNICANNSNGDIEYDFYDCFFQGDITTINAIGFTRLNSTDVKFTQNSSIYFSIGSGFLFMYIIQNELIEANVTCNAEIRNGGLYFEYSDNSPEIGARFEIPTNTSTAYDYPLWYEKNYNNWPVFGFYNETPNLDLIHTYSDHFLHISEDLHENRAINYYNWTIYIIRQWFDFIINSTG